MKTLRYRGVPVIGFAGYSGSGKTTVIRDLIPALKEKGVRPSVIKHAHHDFDIDYPGKDSYELRKAGAGQIIVGSAHRWAMITESGDGREPDLTEFLAQLNLLSTDVILVEGFRDISFPKIEIFRTSEARSPFYKHDAYIIAIVSDAALPGDSEIPVFGPENSADLADFVVDYCQATTAS
jgi:molybdopterin-guanine dinucleotide biosynthesis protein MobB